MPVLPRVNPNSESGVFGTTWQAYLRYPDVLFGAYQHFQGPFGKEEKVKCICAVNCIVYDLIKFVFDPRSEITLSKTRYEGGLGRLDGTQRDVTVMQETLKELQPKLVKATQEVQTILTRVEKESADVAEVEKIVKIDEEAAMVRFTILLSIMNFMNYHDIAHIELRCDCRK